MATWPMARKSKRTRHPRQVANRRARKPKSIPSAESKPSTDCGTSGIAGAPVLLGSRSPLAASRLIEAFRKLWPAAWGARMKHVLRNALYTRLEQTCPSARQPPIDAACRMISITTYRPPFRGSPSLRLPATKSGPGNLKRKQGVPGALWR